MFPLADDSAAFHDDDFVGGQDCAEAVSDDEGRGAVHELFDGLLDEVLAFGIDLAGGFVEDEDRGFAKDGTGDAEALSLATGELAAHFAQYGVVAARFFRDKFVGKGALGGVFYVLEQDVPLHGGTGIGRGDLISVGDVLGDGAGENDAVLGDDADLVAEGTEGGRADVEAIDGDAAALGVVEAREEWRAGLFYRCRCGRRWRPIGLRGTRRSTWFRAGEGASG